MKGELVEDDGMIGSEHVPEVDTIVEKKLIGCKDGKMEDQIMWNSCGYE